MLLSPVIRSGSFTEPVTLDCELDEISGFFSPQLNGSGELVPAGIGYFLSPKVS